jgi:hypothetical protein
VNEPQLQTVVSRCLAKQRNQRFQSAKEMREALQALLPTLPVGAGGLKLLGSIGMAGAPAVSDSNAPPRPDDAPLAPPSSQARHEPTLVAPPSDPEISPVGNEMSVAPSTRSTNERSSSPPVLSERSPARKARGRLAATIGGIAVAAVVAIVLSTSGRSSSKDAAPAVPIVVPTESPAAAPAAQRTEVDPASSARAAPAPSQAPLRVEAAAARSTVPSSASAAAASSSRKAAGTRSPGEAPRSKSVTRVESAGF